MVIDRMSVLLQSCMTDTPLCPPKTVFNQQWLLQLVLDWFATHSVVADHQLAIPANSRWFAGGRLRTTFQKRHQDDQLAEKRTQVDGVIGQFAVRLKASHANITLDHAAQHFVVLAAQLLEPLAAGIQQARYFDQAAQTIACIAETLNHADRYPVDMAHLAFYVISPQAQIVTNVFAEPLNREAIRQKTKQRVRAYDKQKKEWYSEWFIPTLEQITIDTLSWESILDLIHTQDAEAGEAFTAFYQQCLAFD